uniref:CCHC-type domain-containing protein n=1 Tax=Clytia hemisphaerica TaxID=252671 RepID=A0A7M5X4P3_9CNID
MVAFFIIALGSLEHLCSFHHQKGIIYHNKMSITEQINTAIKDALAQSLGTIVEETTKEVKRSMQDDVTDTIVKKVRQEQVPTFKKKFNSDQYKHTKVMEKIMSKINSNLEANDITKAKESTSEGMKEIYKRQKLIQIADREEDGWEVIKCYQSDNLASDSEDEKRLNKSRRQAKQNKKEARTRRLNYRKKFDQNGSRDYTSNSFYSTRYPPKDRSCYYCGKEGHFQYNCPVKRSDLNKGH